MNRVLFLFATLGLIPSVTNAYGGEQKFGKGMTDANKQRLVLDDLEDNSDWYNGSRDETTLSSCNQPVKQGTTALLFANKVDHTKGEKNYPVGWPRTGKDLTADSLTDWSHYDFFECWIFARTSRQALPKTPIGVGFYHSGHKRSTHIRLGEVKKDTWVKIVVPLDQLLDSRDVQRVQFNISEADYKHGDQVDFVIDDLVLTRYVNPAIAAVNLQRQVLYSHDRNFASHFKLVGHRGLETVNARLTIGHSDAAVASAQCQATREGEITVQTDGSLEPGAWWAALELRGEAGELVDRKQVAFRVIAGPFEEE